MDPSAEAQAVAEVTHIEALWAHAHETLDLDLIEQILADDYTIVQTDGRVVDREETLASYRSGQRYWEFARSEVLSVRVYGETAVVLGRWRAKGRNGSEMFDYSAVYTSVHVRRNDHWQIVADHATPIEVDR